MRKAIQILLFILILSGCHQSVGYEEISESNKIGESTEVSSTEVHYRTTEFNRTFNYHLISDEGLSIGFEEGLFNAQEELKVYNDVSAFIYHSISYSSDDISPIYIYIVDDLPDNSIVVNDKAVYCPRKYYLDGKHKTAIIQKMFQLEEYWQAIGLYNNIEGVKADTALIKSNSQIAYDISSILYTRYIDEFNTKEDLNLFTNLSTSFVDYIINEHGIKKLNSEDSVIIELYKEWASEIGFDGEYSDTYDHIYQYTSFKLNDDGVLQADYRGTKYYFIKIDGMIEDSSDINEFLYKSTHAIDFLFDTIEEASNNGEISYRKDRDINIYIDAETYVSRANGDDIYLNDLKHHAHEFVHILLESEVDDHWESEGIAEFLGVIYCPSEYMYNREFLFDLFKEYSNKYQSLDKSSLEYNIFDYYYSHTENINMQSEFDMRVYYDANSYMFNYIDRDLDKYYAKPLYDHFKIEETMRVDGDELSYFEAGSFTAFLVDHYSLSEVLEFVNNPDYFEMIFGETYKELKNQWLQYLGN